MYVHCTYIVSFKRLQNIFKHKKQIFKNTVFLFHFNLIINITTLETTEKLDYRFLGGIPKILLICRPK